MRDNFWAAAKATTSTKFREVMGAIRDISKPAYDWLEQLDPRQSAIHAMDPACKSEHITSNFVESFNAWVGEARFMAPISLLEHIRMKFTKLVYTRSVISQDWTRLLPPRVFMRLRGLSQRARFCKVQRC